MQTVTLACGETVSAYDMGTWHMGDDPGVRAEELATLRLGLDLGAMLTIRALDRADGLPGGARLAAAQWRHHRHTEDRQPRQAQGKSSGV